MYTKQSETTAKIEVGKCVFFINSKEQDFSLVGIEADEDMILNEKERAIIHSRMLEDFEDKEKVVFFEELLEKDPSTAYITYINTQINKQND